MCCGDRPPSFCSTAGSMVIFIMNQHSLVLQVMLEVILRNDVREYVTYAGKDAVTCGTPSGAS